MLDVVEQLRQWGHKVDIVLPHVTPLDCTDLSLLRSYDAYVLKATVRDPGLAILEAADALGVLTINTPRAIHLTANKAAVAALAREHHIPFPITYFLGSPRALMQVPHDAYPLVIKPNKGSFKYRLDIHRVQTPAEAAQLELHDDQEYLVMPYIENKGFDIKLFVSGQKVFATTRSSPLHDSVPHREIAVTDDMRELALRVGQVLGLDLYGVDVLETPQGFIPIDINEFPGYQGITNPSMSIAEHILHTAERA